MLLWLLKLPIKLLSLPVLAALALAHLLGRLATGVSALAVWLLFAALLLAGAYCVACGLWTSLLLLADGWLLALALQLGAVLVVELTSSLQSRLVRFLRS